MDGQQTQSDGNSSQNPLYQVSQIQGTDSGFCCFFQMRVIKLHVRVYKWNQSENIMLHIEEEGHQYICMCDHGM